MTAVAESVEMVERYGYHSEILVASIRHPMHVVEALRVGSHVATMPFKVMESLFNHPLTEAGLKRFIDDWKSAGLEIFEKTRA